MKAAARSRFVGGRLCGSGRPHVEGIFACLAMTIAILAASPVRAVESLTADEVDSLRRQLASCWKPPAASGPVVRVQITFRPDGSLAEEPVVLDPQRTEQFETFAAAARKAVRKCQPYGMPPEKFRVWEVVIVNFDPRDSAAAEKPVPPKENATPDDGSGGPGNRRPAGPEYLGS